MRPPSASAVAVTALVALIGTLLAACTGDEPSPEPPELPVLEPQWESEALPGASRAWQVGDTVVVASERRLAALDPSTGETQWDLRLPAEPCAWPDAPNEDGLLVVLLDRPTTTPRRCLDVTAIDLAEGDVRWQRGLRYPVAYERAEYDGVGAGERTVGVVDGTFQVVARLDASTGQTLSTARAEDERVAVAGSRLTRVVFERPDDERTVVVEDLDSGDDVARYAAGDTYNAQVVVDDPLVVATERGTWGGDLRVGSEGTVVGRGPGAFTAVDEDLLVADPGSDLFAHDLATGAEVAAVPLGSLSAVAGLRDSTGARGLSAIVVDPAPYWQETPSPVVEQIDLTAPDQRQALGAVDGTPLVLVDDTLITAGARTLRAYQLPGEGPAVAAFDDALAWAEDDLRPAEAFDACTAVSTVTLTGLGLAADERGVGSCAWGGGEHLQVSVDASTPSGTTPAEQVAIDQLDLMGADTPELPGVGDQAYVDADRFRAVVTARYRNVVVTVRSTVESTTPQRARRAAEAAAAEVIAELEERAED